MDISLHLFTLYQFILWKPFQVQEKNMHMHKKMYVVQLGSGALLLSCDNSFQAQLGIGAQYFICEHLNHVQLGIGELNLTYENSSKVQLSQSLVG